MTDKKRRKKAIQEGVGDSVAATEQVVAAELISSSSKKQCVSGLSLKRAPSQMSIDAAFSKNFVQTDLRAANNSRLTTAIADMCHAENLPDRLVSTARFKEVIEAAKMVGPDYKLPNRNDIGGWLLEKNALAYKQGNLEEVTKDAPKFGYTMAGDGAQVIKKPLFNGYVMNGNCFPVVACIRDCSAHLAEGDSKNCVYIADVFTEMVRLYDPKSTDTDVFYFDGAANVQKAGKILEARFPRTMCLYGGGARLGVVVFQGGKDSRDSGKMHVLVFLPFQVY